MSVVTSVLAFCLKAVFGSRIAPSKLRLIVEVVAQARVDLIERAFGGDEDEQPAGPHLAAIPSRRSNRGSENCAR